MSNLPDGCTVNNIPGFRPEDEEHDIMIESLSEELQQTIKQYQQEYYLTDHDLAEVLDELKPLRRVVNG